MSTRHLIREAEPYSPALYAEIETDGGVLRMRQVAHPTLTDAATEDFCATHEPWRQDVVEEWVQEGEREVCIPAAGTLFWQHFHHVKEPVMVKKAWRIRTWLLPDGRLARRRDEEDQ